MGTLKSALRRSMAAVWLAASVSALAACGDNLPAADDPGGSMSDAGPDEPSDAAVQTLTPCLDRPTDMQKPPTGQLPCDLLPPGFGG